jgi:hypothetical protein
VVREIEGAAVHLRCESSDFALDGVASVINPSNGHCVGAVHVVQQAQVLM